MTLEAALNVGLVALVNEENVYIKIYLKLVKSWGVELTQLHNTEKFSGNLTNTLSYDWHRTTANSATNHQAMLSTRNKVIRNLW